MQMAKTLRRAGVSRPEQTSLHQRADRPHDGGRDGKLRERGGYHHCRAWRDDRLCRPRVIKDTTQAELPPGFQTAEFLLDRGLVDAIVPRKEMKKQLIEYLDFMTVRSKKTAAAG